MYWPFLKLVSWNGPVPTMFVFGNVPMSFVEICDHCFFCRMYAGMYGMRGSGLSVLMTTVYLSGAVIDLKPLTNVTKFDHSSFFIRVSV